MSSDLQIAPARARAYTAARVLGIALVALAAAAALWSFVLYEAGPAPDYALNSSLLFRLELAVVALLLVAIPAVLIAHLLAGRLPRTIGKSGIDFGENASTEHDRRGDQRRATEQLTVVLVVVCPAGGSTVGLGALGAAQP